MQLHPGDLGWFWRFGAEATAAAVRTWSRDGQILAVGLLDGPELLRLTIAPDAHRDEAITVAAAAALQELGSSSAIVCTPSSNVGAVATYKSAGFRQRPEIRDRRRDA
ncbi:hypothetical protein GCM10022206_39050 [Streptomyces chiangmaiensis]